MGKDHEHRVCTYAEAERAIRSHQVIYINNCFCRTPARDGETKYEYCGHPVETCMSFIKIPDALFEQKEITQAEALGIFNNWKDQHNFFRFMENEKWVCLCCTCGCQWFRDKDGNHVPDTYKPSPFIEKTDISLCIYCGVCAEVCPNNARAVEDGVLKVLPELCSGCSACEYVCPTSAIVMTERPKKKA